MSIHYIFQVVRVVNYRAILGDIYRAILYKLFANSDKKSPGYLIDRRFMQTDFYFRVAALLKPIHNPLKKRG